MTTLISFLGKGQDGRGYRDANYKFENGTLIEKQKYIGLALANILEPEKIIFLGTTGSMWDVFLEQGSDGLEAEWVQLSDSVRNEGVKAKQLEPFEGYLSAKLNTDVRCLLIPFAKNTVEQVNILSVLSDNLDNEESIVLDVTHGFRHLPMLALVAARFLQQTKSIKTDHIYYGALDMTKDNQTPVLKLNGLLDMLDWVDALTTFDKDGDYAQFEPLLLKEGLPKDKANCLKEAAFFERTSNSAKAREKLSTAYKHIENLSSPMFDLFKPQLTSRLKWFKKKNRGLREQTLAKEYLQRRDYLRAVIYAMEGIISNNIHQNKKDENSHDLRKKASDKLAENNKSFKKLRPLRNTLVHGNRNNKETSSVTAQEDKLYQSLQGRFEHLLK